MYEQIKMHYSRISSVLPKKIFEYTGINNYCALDWN